MDSPIGQFVLIGNFRRRLARELLVYTSSHIYVTLLGLCGQVEIHQLAAAACQVCWMLVFGMLSSLPSKARGVVVAFMARMYIRACKPSKK